MRFVAQPLGGPIEAHAASAAVRAARDGAWNCDLPASLEEVPRASASAAGASFGDRRGRACPVEDLRRRR